MDIDLAPAPEPPHTAPFAQRVEAVARAHIEAPGFSVEALAHALGFGPRHLRRRLKRASGETPGAMLRRLRLERSAQLLASGEGTVAEVGRRVGYLSASQFRRAFREAYGVAPSEARTVLV